MRGAFGFLGLSDFGLAAFFGDAGFTAAGAATTGAGSDIMRVLNLRLLESEKMKSFHRRSMCADLPRLAL